MEANSVTRDNFGMYANTASGPGPALMSASTLLGDDVYNKDGEELGDIKDFMIDMASGKVAYAVLSFGGLLGMGDKLFAVPWAALALDPTNKRFTLNVPKDALKDAPGFNKERWPVMSDRTWASGVQNSTAVLLDHESLPATVPANDKDVCVRKPRRAREGCDPSLRNARARRCCDDVPRATMPPKCACGRIAHSPTYHLSAPAAPTAAAAAVHAGRVGPQQPRGSIRSNSFCLTFQPRAGLPISWSSTWTRRTTMLGELVGAVHPRVRPTRSRLSRFSADPSSRQRTAR